MGINIRQKGQEGEREVARTLNAIITTCLEAHGLPLPEKDVVQRNQNQSAVGGNDLSNCFGLSIEVKRQEALSVNTWWAQCCKAAQANNETPVLVYRQNRKAWRVVTMVWLPLPAAGGTWASTSIRAEFDWDTFKAWFHQWVDRKLQNGELPRV